MKLAQFLDTDGKILAELINLNEPISRVSGILLKRLTDNGYDSIPTLVWVRSGPSKVLFSTLSVVKDAYPGIIDSYMHSISREGQMTPDHFYDNWQHKAARVKLITINSDQPMQEEEVAAPVHWSPLQLFSQDQV